MALRKELPVPEGQVPARLEDFLAYLRPQDTPWAEVDLVSWLPDLITSAEGGWPTDDDWAHILPAIDELAHNTIVYRPPVPRSVRVTVTNPNLPLPIEVERVHRFTVGDRPDTYESESTLLFSYDQVACGAFVGLSVYRPHTGPRAGDTLLDDLEVSSQLEAAPLDPAAALLPNASGILLYRMPMRMGKRTKTFDFTSFHGQEIERILPYPSQ